MDYTSVEIFFMPLMLKTLKKKLKQSSTDHMLNVQVLNAPKIHSSALSVISGLESYISIWFGQELLWLSKADVTLTLD